MSIAFKNNNTPHTIGVEMELQVIDSRTGMLTPLAPEILELTNDDKITGEMFQSTLEIITGVCNNVNEISRDLQQSLKKLHEVCYQKELSFSGTATNPIADYRDRIVTATPRYHLLMDRNQWLIQRMAVYGLHIHIGMSNGDSCIRFNNFLIQLLPHFIALSASSPFWQGHHTGLAACRPTIYEAHPTSGMPQLFENWDQFSERYDQLIATGSINSMKDIWWDLRPSPVYGTLELRICDGPATMDELLAITAFVHCLAIWFSENDSFFTKQNPGIPDRWILRENKWRAIRYGLDAGFINHRTKRVFPLRNQLEKWFGMIRPYAIQLGYDQHFETLGQILKNGNSSMRQSKIFEQTGSVEAVNEFNIREFEKGSPIFE